MIVSTLLVLCGLAVMIGGGQLLIVGASAIARRLGISELAIGLTVVAFGTSLPETAVNVSGTLNGLSDLCFGNVVGSNIANIGVILGICAMIRPLTIHVGLVVREIPMMILTAFVALMIGCDMMLGDGAVNMIGRTDGAVLLLLFALFLYYTVRDVLTQRNRDAFIAEATQSVSTRHASIAAALAMIGAGLLLLVGGGTLTVHHAALLARAAAVPEVIVGLTLVAIGTSLPELVTSILAVRRGQSDLAVGNIVGSNIFNLLFILGLSASIRPLDVPRGGAADLLVMTGFSLVLLPLAITHRRRIVRSEGLLLLIGYVAYAAWRMANE